MPARVIGAARRQPARAADNAAQRHQLGRINRFLYHRQRGAVVAPQIQSAYQDPGLRSLDAIIWPSSPGRRRPGRRPGAGRPVDAAEERQGNVSQQARAGYTTAGEWSPLLGLLVEARLSRFER